MSTMLSPSLISSRRVNPANIPTTALLPIYFRSAAGPSVLYVSAKRALDIMISSMAMVCLFPLISIIGLLVYLTDFGPVFFRQRRVGLNGQEFWFYKIRSMIVGAEKKLDEQKKKGRNIRKDDDKGFKDPFDDRRTWIGKFIRKFSIDELPQFWNVLRGEMTIVGPRPAIPGEVSRYNHHQRRRLAVTPGLTCIW
jgi:lipopolysaccharide/colanic/teichoic acid biosynthesis glycosyltransferase